MTRLTPFGTVDRGQKAAILYMCRESKMPAVLTENLFIDVAKDAAKLKLIEVLDAIVDGHVVGIAKYLGLKAKEIPKNSQVAPDIYVGDVKIGQGDNVNGDTLASIRAVAQALGA